MTNIVLIWCKHVPGMVPKFWYSILLSHTTNYLDVKNFTTLPRLEWKQGQSLLQHGPNMVMAWPNKLDTMDILLRPVARMKLSQSWKFQSFSWPPPGTRDIDQPQSHTPVQSTRLSIIIVKIYYYHSLYSPIKHLCRKKSMAKPH